MKILIFENHDFCDMEIYQMSEILGPIWSPDEQMQIVFVASVDVPVRYSDENTFVLLQENNTLTKTTKRKL